MKGSRRVSKKDSKSSNKNEKSDNLLNDLFTDIEIIRAILDRAGIRYEFDKKNSMIIIENQSYGSYAGFASQFSFNPLTHRLMRVEAYE